MEKNNKLKFFVINVEAFRTRKGLDFTKKVLEHNTCYFVFIRLQTCVFRL